MKVLVTVGTTKFDSLIKYLDIWNCSGRFHFEFQIADGLYIPKNHPYFSFDRNIQERYISADIIVTHAGGGTIYRILELKKKIVIVPNLERLDKHQLDIAEYMHEKGYAFSVKSVNDLPLALDSVATTDFRIFNKTHFFKSEEILSFFNDSKEE